MAEEEIMSFPPRRNPAAPLDPPAYPREHGRILPRVRLWDGSTPWLVTKYGLQRELLRDQRFSADPTAPGYPAFSPATAATHAAGRGLIGIDDPEHLRLRRMLAPAFTAGRANEWRSTIREAAESAVDKMLEGSPPADLVEDFALPVPSTVIAKMLGVPLSDQAYFQRCSRALTSWNSSPADAVAAKAELRGYIDALISEREQRPGADLISELTQQQLMQGNLSRDELTATAVLLLVAGHETTASMISLGVLALLTHPSELEVVMRGLGDRAVMADAVEELLRFLSVAHSGRRRAALEDVSVGETVIRQGDGLILANDAGNRDPEHFDEPDRLNVRRGSRQHLAFGAGIHQCIGHSIARVELQETLTVLFTRVPSLRIAVPLADIEFSHQSTVFGARTLPVAWGR